MFADKRYFLNTNTCILQFNTSFDLGVDIEKQKQKRSFSYSKKESSSTELTGKTNLITKIKQIANDSYFYSLCKQLRKNKQQNPQADISMCKSKNRLDKIKRRKGKQFTKNLFETWRGSNNFLPKCMREQSSNREGYNLNSQFCNIKYDRLEGTKIKQLSRKSFYRKNQQILSGQVFHLSVKKPLIIQLKRKNKFRSRTVQNRDMKRTLDITPW